MDEILKSVAIQIKAIEKYFLVLPFITPYTDVVLTFKSVNEMPYF